VSDRLLFLVTWRKAFIRCSFFFCLLSLSLSFFFFLAVLNLPLVLKRVLHSSDEAGHALVVFSRQCSDRSGSLNVSFGDISSISIKYTSHVLACLGW